MSNVYAHEPSTNAKVIMHTDYGPLEIELWCKETPLASRNFIQLCMEGYYEETIFHRLVPGFVLQGGDPTGTGQGGQSIYEGRTFPLETHTRLSFARRGLLGVAAMNERAEGASQFFFTLAPTPELDRRATLFGKIVGDTVYNLLRMGELEADERTERPLHPPRIRHIEIITNPFDDIVPRELEEVRERRARRLAKSQPTIAKQEPRQPSVPIIQSRKTLSFQMEDDDADGGEGEYKGNSIKRQSPSTMQFGRIKSSHDVLDDPKLSRRAVIERGPAESTRPSSDALMDDKQKEEDRSICTFKTKDHANPNQALLGESTDQLAHLRSQIAIVQQQIRQMDAPPQAAPPPSDTTIGQTRADSVARLLGTRKKLPLGPEDESPSTSSSIHPKAFKEQPRLSMGKRPKTATAEMDTLLALNRFREKLRTLDTTDPVELVHSKRQIEPSKELDICKLHGLVNCESCRDTFGLREEGSDEGWLMHRLIFDKEAGYRKVRSDLDQLQVIDPRDRLERK